MRALVELKGISKNFDEKSVFSDFYFSVHPGQMVGLTGPSGSGKTTILNIIGMLDCDYSGTYIYKEMAVKKTAREGLKMRRNEFSYIFQNFALLEDKTVEENLRIVTRDKKRMEEALEQVGLEGILKQKIYTLSGGQAQRVALARAFINDSPVILADEPTGSLDKKNSNMVMELLQAQQKNGKTVILVTHDESLHSYCDEVVSL
ncbi:MAG: ATP-binding cassette domain-containing protein [Actinomycetaceae bacterium]|nr:ATP-binding cassette domain-containing protein [Actinomycetaceae bacterium]